MKNLFLCLFALVSGFNGYCFSVVREVSKAQINVNESVKVTVTVKREGAVGPGRLVEKIPNGFDVVVNNKAGGTVSLANEGMLKIKWLGIPTNEEFKIEYTIRHLGGTGSSASIDGSFSYAKDGVMKKITIASTPILIGGEQETEIVTRSKKNVLKKTSAPAADITKSIAENKTKKSAQPIQSDTAKSVIQNKVTSDVKKQIENNKTEVIYRVQIGAFTNPVDLSSFNGVQDVYYKKTGGYFKYYSGIYVREVDARLRISEVKSKGILDAFIVTEAKK